MSTSTSADAGSPAADELIRSVLDSGGLAAIDRRIAGLCEQVLATNPRLAQLIAGYQDDIDLLLDLRLWLTGGISD